ncbi:tetratricopeptide repeat protein [Enterobacter cloacae]|uniref:tetratricopeptide repeat protein n=1 Tax=Enterobacter cloacae TaxID=550 RepID=UPI002876D774|nr:tetratricopeptide repeat protein [Enterobacter cloacae]MDS0107104.1 tetratricopeptide repeat protein [Enterobacter cloacae subsp. cloacae]
MRVFYGMLGVFVFLSCTLSVRASDDYYTNLKKDANSGNALAQYKLGAMYLVVSGDYKKAFYWTNKPAIQGNSDAQNNLGLLYYYGQGVDKNIKKAGYWWGKAADAGNASAQNDLAMLYKNGLLKDARCDKIMDLLNSSAQKDFELAYLNIGNLYSTGECVNRDMHEAVIWWEKASIKNNGQAEFNLAGAYMRGDGVFPGSGMADIYLKKSCSHGYAGACDLLKK